MTSRFGRGFGPANLSRMKRFFLLWSAERIFQTPSEKFEDGEDSPDRVRRIEDLCVQRNPADTVCRILAGQHGRGPPRLLLVSCLRNSLARPVGVIPCNLDEA